MTTSITYPTPASSLPDAVFRWLDAGDNPIDFSTGWSFRMTISQPPNVAKIIKVSGISGTNGANGSGNLIVSWDSNELTNLSAGRWYFQITATQTATGKQRILNGSMMFDAAKIAEA
jgi:hypothetical protein